MRDVVDVVEVAADALQRVVAAGDVELWRQIIESNRPRVSKTLARFGRIDGVVMNAGVELGGYDAKTKILSFTVAYGGDADEDLLRRLASSPQHSFRCRDGKELRAFLATVGATLSASIPRGIDPKQALSEIKQ